MSLLLTQVDKVLLSKLLSLEHFGFYTLAAAVASAVFVVVTPITQAFYPRLCQCLAEDDTHQLSKTYHTAAQLVSIIAGSIGAVIIVYSKQILLVWTHDPALAAATAPLLSILALGNLLNSFMLVPYQAQLAYGWTKLTLGINVIMVMLLVPAILWTVPTHGAVAAACVWALLNAIYILFGAHLMYRKILTKEKMLWYVYDVALPLLSIAGALASLEYIWPLVATWCPDYCRIFAAVLLSLFASASVTAACFFVKRPKESLKI